MRNVGPVIVYPKTCLPQEIADLERKFRKLLKIFSTFHPLENERRIQDSWQMAVRAHGKLFLKNDRRKSGEHYLHHLLDVSTILAEWGMDSTTLAAGILHDCAEDTDVTIEELHLQFGERIANIIAGVTKFNTSASVTKDDRQADYIRRMLRAMQMEIRVAIIKLADRLHNMRTLESMPPEKQLRIAKETLDVYCPLAHTLGIANVRRELEDLAFEFTFPERYAVIYEAVEKIRPEAERQLRKIASELRSAFENKHISVSYRLKGVSSIHEYLENHQLSIPDIQRIDNLLKIVVICAEEHHCYDLLPHLRRAWPKNESSLSRDGIAVPRRNGFSALLERRVEIGGFPFEIQIFTESSYRVAEFGITADWRYRSDQDVPVKNEVSLSSLEGAFKWMLEIKDNAEFLSAFRSELNSREIYVYTKNKKRIYLPEYAVPLDLAYHVSSTLGHEATSCLVNGKSYPLTSPLRIGDIVEICPTKGSLPQAEWLTAVRTTRAKGEIRHRLNKGKNGDPASRAINDGKRMLRKVLKRFNLSESQLALLAQELVSDFNLTDLHELYRDIGFGRISIDSVISKLFPPRS